MPYAQRNYSKMVFIYFIISPHEFRTHGYIHIHKFLLDRLYHHKQRSDTTKVILPLKSSNHKIIWTNIEIFVGSSMSLLLFEINSGGGIGPAIETTLPD